MRRWLIAVALSLAACERSSAQGDFASSGAPSPAVQARPASAIFGFWSQSPHPAVVRVISPERNSASLGSGTLVDVSDRHGLVITNWHVVKDAAGNVIVSFPDGFQTPGYVIKTDRDWDLAAVAIWRPKVDPVPIAPAVPARGEPLTIAGYGSGNYRAQTGRCMQYLSPGIGLPYDIVEVSAAARHGDSGGPIFNSRGELAGVLFGEGEGMTSGSASARVRWFLASLGAGPREPGTSVTGAVAGSVPSATIANSNRPAGANPPLVAVPPRAASADSSGPNYPSTGAPPFDWRQFASRMGTTAATGGSTAGQSNPASDLTASSPLGKSAPPATSAVPAEIGADPAPPGEQVDWEDLVGHTPGQKVKTGLAAAAVLFVLYQLSRRIA
jgi:S1-C subfamily serine protease